jgi:hypothetical protein
MRLSITFYKTPLVSQEEIRHSVLLNGYSVNRGSYFWIDFWNKISHQYNRYDFQYSPLLHQIFFKHILICKKTFHASQILVIYPFIAMYDI